jgi:hypothetical protein
MTTTAETIGPKAVSLGRTAWSARRAGPTSRARRVAGDTVSGIAGAMGLDRKTVRASLRKGACEPSTDGSGPC